MAEFKELDEVPENKFKGYYTKVAREVFERLNAHPEKEGGFLEENNERNLLGIYNSMQSLIRQGKYTFSVSLDMKEHKIWIKKMPKTA